MLFATCMLQTAVIIFISSTLQSTAATWDVSLCICSISQLIATKFVLKVLCFKGNLLAYFVSLATSWSTVVTSVHMFSTVWWHWPLYWQKTPNDNIAKICTLCTGSKFRVDVYAFPKCCSPGGRRFPKIPFCEKKRMSEAFIAEKCWIRWRMFLKIARIDRDIASKKVYQWASSYTHLTASLVQSSSYRFVLCNFGMQFVANVNCHFYCHLQEFVSDILVYVCEICGTHVWICM